MTMMMKTKTKAFTGKNINLTRYLFAATKNRPQATVESVKSLSIVIVKRGLLTRADPGGRGVHAPLPPSLALPFTNPGSALAC